MKKIILLFAGLALVLSSAVFSGCSDDKVGSEKKLEGTWYEVRYYGWDEEDGDWEEELEDISYTTFKSDGTGYYSWGEESGEVNFTWTKKDDKLTIVTKYSTETYTDTYTILKLNSTTFNFRDDYEDGYSISENRKSK